MGLELTENVLVEILEEARNHIPPREEPDAWRQVVSDAIKFVTDHGLSLGELKDRIRGGLSDRNKFCRYVSRVLMKAGLDDGLGMDDLIKHLRDPDLIRFREAMDLQIRCREAILTVERSELLKLLKKRRKGNSIKIIDIRYVSPFLFNFYNIFVMSESDDLDPDVRAEKKEYLHRMFERELFLVLEDEITIHFINGKAKRLVEPKIRKWVAELTRGDEALRGHICLELLEEFNALRGGEVPAEVPVDAPAEAPVETTPVTSDEKRKSVTDVGNKSRADQILILDTNILTLLSEQYACQVPTDDQELIDLVLSVAYWVYLKEKTVDLEEDSRPVEWLGQAVGRTDLIGMIQAYENEPDEGRQVRLRARVSRLFKSKFSNLQT